MAAEPNPRHAMDILLENAELEVQKSDPLAETAKINTLPPDVLIKIFGYLTAWDILYRARMVCKKWMVYMRHPWIWKGKHLWEFRADSHLIQVCRFSPSIDYLDLHVCTNAGLSPKGISKALNYVELRKIEMLFAYDADETIFELLATKAPDLTVLDMYEMGYRAPEKLIRGDVLKCVALNKHLVEYRTVGSENLTDDILSFILDRCPHIKVLKLEKCHSLTIKTLHYLAEASKLEELWLVKSVNWRSKTVETVAGIRSLKRFRFQFYEDPMDFFHPEQQKINRARETIAMNAMLDKVTAALPEMDTMILKNNPLLTDQAVIYITQNLRHLKHLNVKSCFYLTQTSIDAMAENSKELEYLDFSYVDVSTDPMIDGLKERLKPTLKKVVCLRLEHPRVHEY